MNSHELICIMHIHELITIQEIAVLYPLTLIDTTFQCLTRDQTKSLPLKLMVYIDLKRKISCIGKELEAVYKLALLI